MLRSMTGFGRAEEASSGITIKVEIRSLNGKQLEARLRIPDLLKPYEMEIRSLLKDRLQRGSVDLFIQIAGDENVPDIEINQPLAKKYYGAIHTLSQDLSLEKDGILAALMRIPDIFKTSEKNLSENDFQPVKSVISKAIEDLDRHRLNEGNTLKKDLLLRITHIEELQEKVKMIEPGRKEEKRKRLEEALKNWAGQEQIDQNRLEQELIYYIEKLDISEEQVRLANHCRYFREIVESTEGAKGRKLNFILQEMGREINTTGSKANDASLQRCVVQMKDELEKAKEQVLNVL